MATQFLSKVDRGTKTSYSDVGPGSYEVSDVHKSLPGFAPFATTASLLFIVYLI
jgi:hypothetical protein